jgi:hypothetical protein
MLEVENFAQRGLKHGPGVEKLSEIRSIDLKCPIDQEKKRYTLAVFDKLLTGILSIPGNYHIRETMLTNKIA